MPSVPSLKEIENAADALSGRIVKTPCVQLNSDRIIRHLPEGAAVTMKLELFQQAGSFKARGVLLAVDALTQEQRKAGVTAVSAGNHALAVSWGAKNAGVSAKVVMPKTADRIRVEGCRALGAEVTLMDDVGLAFEEVARLVNEEGRTMLHPFESPYMTLGAATCGLEFASSVPEMEVALIPVGGGGLIAGMSTAIRHALPDCEIIGVEPVGADSMWQSFQTGGPVQLDHVNTVADSLGAPMTLPDSFAITRHNVGEIIRIQDEDMQIAMKRLYDCLKIVAEPACAATTAAVMGELRERLKGKSVAIIACGSNISMEKFNRLTDA